MRTAYYLPISEERYLRLSRVDRQMIRDELDDLLEELEELSAVSRTERKEL